MRILVVSGYLGAGKTTFIQGMARATGLPLVVYENEYAGVGVDAGRLSGEGGLRVYESVENCVCCSGKADFAQSLLTIHASLDPAYLVVEPTGMARLGNVLAAVRQVMYGDMTLLAPVAVVDAPAFFRHRSEEVFLDQLENAGVVLLSKTGRMLPEEVDRVRARIAALAPQAEVVPCPRGGFDAAWYRRLLSRAIEGGNPPVAAAGAVGSMTAAVLGCATSAPAGAAGPMAGAAAGAEISASPGSVAPADAEEGMDRMTVADAVLASPAQLACLLDALAWGAGGGVERAKGCLPCGGEWVRFDLAGGSWEIMGCAAQESPQLAIIGRGLDGDAIRRMLPGARLHVHRARGEHAHGASAAAPAAPVAPEAA